MGRFKFLSLLAALLLVGVMRPAQSAAVVTLTFDSIPSGLYTVNLIEAGFRISPECHLDVVTPSSLPWSFPATSNYFGTDRAGCNDPTTSNQDYLGSVRSDGVGVYFDRAGSLFSLTSLDYWNSESAIVISSNGGYRELLREYQPYELRSNSFSGAEWSDLTWIQLSVTGGGVPYAYFDNLTFQVPEPGTVSLLLLAATGAMMFRRAARAV